MKPNFAHWLCATALATVVASGTIAARTREPLAGLTHSPMQAYRNPDGSIARLRNSIVTGYWSGYAVNTSAPYTSASGTFQVPSVVYDGLANTTEYVLQWVGVGGYGDSTLIQIGAMEIASTSDTASYLVWYELYPAGAQQIPHTVKPGDIITASLQCMAGCWPRNLAAWPGRSNRRVELDPEPAVPVEHGLRGMDRRGAVVRQRLPLADYGQAAFDPVLANGANPSLTVSDNGIQMSDPGGDLELLRHASSYLNEALVRDASCCYKEPCLSGSRFQGMG